MYDEIPLLATFFREIRNSRLNFGMIQSYILYGDPEINNSFCL